MTTTDELGPTEEERRREEREEEDEKDDAENFSTDDNRAHEKSGYAELDRLARASNRIERRLLRGWERLSELAGDVSTAQNTTSSYQRGVTRVRALLAAMEAEIPAYDKASKAYDRQARKLDVR